MERCEKVELTVMCMLRDKTKILVQDRAKQDWPGISFPGGHVEKNESFIKAIKREFKEETGLDIFNPHICGIKQWETKSGSRYIVLLFRADEFSGTLESSSEGEVFWIERKDLMNYNLAIDFCDMVKLMEDDALTEFYKIKHPDGTYENFLY